jgi:biotin operon repressor
MEMKSRKTLILILILFTLLGRFKSAVQIGNQLSTSRSAVLLPDGYHL